MHAIDLLPGTTVDRAAVLLVANAPARADFNGITIRARYATTKPRDVAAHYRRLSAERALVWRHSPEGKRYAEEREADRAAKQQAANAGMLALGPLDFESPACRSPRVGGDDGGPGGSRGRDVGP